MKQDAALEKKQGFAMLTVGLMALLAIPVYVIVGIVTIPLGIGMLMVTSDAPWVLNLYPFIFGGTLSGRTPIYFFNSLFGAMVTVLQWALIAWLFGRQVKPDWTRAVTIRNAAGLLVVVAVIGAILLHLVGFQAVWSQGART